MNNKDFILFSMVSLIAAFLLSDFRFLGVRDLDYIATGLQLIEYVLIFFVLYFLFITAQRNLALYKGLNPEFEVWQFGPLTGILITFMTYGQLIFFYLGNIFLKPIRRLRVGRAEKAVSTKEMAAIGVAGPFALFLLSVLILEPLFYLTRAEIFSTMMYVSALIIIYTSLPLPNSNGTNIILYSRVLWLTVLFFGIINLFLIQAMGFYSFLTGLLMAPLAVYIVYKLLN